MYRFIYCFLLLAELIPAPAQETGTELFKKQKKNNRYDAGAPIISPVLIPAYTPEMGFLFTGGCLVTFKTKRNNSYLTHSSLPVILALNTHKDFMVYTTFSSYWFDNRLLINIDALYQNKVDNYWGIGMIKGQTINKDSLTTEYHNKSFRLNPAFVINIIDHFFAGIKVDINKMNATALADLMIEDEYITKNGANISNTGIGLAIYYDSRDVSSYPYKEVYLNLDGLFYDESFSGDYNYQIICLDYRQYQSIIRNGSLLAWQIKSRLGFNDVPWNDMSHPGSVYDLKGYYTGQFRDKSMIYVLLEYRHTFNRRYSDELSRHGLVYWIGGGSVFPDLKSVDKAILSTGLGYRFELQPRINLQIDIGFGTEYVGIYLGFNESF
jgi:hypothetical protein